MSPNTRWPFAIALALFAVAGVLFYWNAQPPSDEASPAEFASLVGQPAPDFGADFALNGTAVRLSDLKGKVVLLDFWAMWCGPCRVTFPHLRDWNARCKDQGLEVVGVTTYYERFGFDKKAGRLTKLTEPLTREQEQQMLRDFADHFQLSYLLLVLSHGEMERVQELYRGGPIPQVVLIDRRGVIRLVRVGAEEENTRALEKMIGKLLAE